MTIEMIQQRLHSFQKGWILQHSEKPVKQGT